MVATYLNNLKLQFAKAKGLEGKSIDNDDFINWMKEQQQIKEYYQHYLLTMGLFYNDKTSVELGKGKYDTITSCDTLATIITRYADTFSSDNNRKKIIYGEFVVRNEENVALVENRLKRGHFVIPLEHYNLFYTQNSCVSQDLLSLLQIHNKGGHIVMGAYGILKDKDRIAKIKYLRMLKESVINNNLKEDYAYVNDCYLYFLHSDYQKVKNYNIKKQFKD